MTNITTTTLQQLNELMQSENLAYKKCCSYAFDCKDATLKAKLGNYAKRHKKRFEALYKALCE
ncbi:MAG: hypothetical protein J6C23_03395 [Clostridia bacterium]|nr:hypothetical protein [Clostridia bacterium]